MLAHSRRLIASNVHKLKLRSNLLKLQISYGISELLKWFLLVFTIWTPSQPNFAHLHTKERYYSNQLREGFVP